MKAQILDISGKKTKEITTKLFEEPIREDIIFKIIETEKIKQPWSHKLGAGMNNSASGKINHRRHVWRTSYGRGMSRVPRKVMWRRGTQFSWVGAIVPSTIGGRRAHGPKGIGKLKKINKKEFEKAFLSALTFTNSVEELKKKYSSLKNTEIRLSLPLIVEDKILELKTKDFFNSLKKILGESYPVAIKKKTIRAGIGKLRSRKNKSNAGVLFVIGNKEEKKIKGIEVIKAKNLIVTNLAANGARLTIFSEKAIEDLEDSIFNKKTKEMKDKTKSKKEKKKWTSN